MEIAGWRTTSMWSRYAIVDETTQADAPRDAFRVREGAEGLPAAEDLGAGAHLKEPVDARVAVLPLRDARQSENSNAKWVGFIPLVPFGWANYDRPDMGSGYLAHAGYNARPAEDYAKAIVEELKVNALFKEVFFTYRTDEPGADWLLTGEITRSDYHGKMFTYLLSFYGSLFWLIGIPAGSAENTLALNLELKRPVDGHVLWRHEIDGNYGKVIGLYYNFSSELEGYPKILRAGLQAGILELDRHLQGHGLTGIAASQYRP